MENNLQITIDAVDDASETIAQMATDVEESLGDLSASFATTSETATQSYDQLTAAMSVDSEDISDAAIAAGNNFDEAMAQMSTSAQDADTSTAASSGNIRSNFIQLGLLGATVFAPLVSFLKDAVGAAQEWNETSAVIVQTLKDTGSSIPIAQIQQFAENMAETTLFTEQDVLQSAELVLSHKDLQGSYQELITLSADAATKMGTDLPSATRTLTNALEDPVSGVNQLNRLLGIGIPASMVNTISNLAKFGDTADADRLILQALNGQISGLTNAAGGAAGASITELSNDVGILSRVIGNDLIQNAIDPLMKKIEPLVLDMINWTAEHPKLTAAILIITVAITGLVVGLAALGVLVLTIGPAFAAVGATLALFADPIPWIIITVGVLAAAIFQHWTDITAWTKSMVDEITFLWQSTWTGVSTFFTSMWNGLKTDIQSAITFIEGLMNGLFSTVSNVTNKILAPIQAIGSFIGNATNAVGGAIGGAVTGAIKAFASGGIVTGPTLAMVGEAGPEAIIPLSAFSGGSSLGGAGLGGGSNGSGNIVINLNGNISDSNTAMMYANQIAKAIQAQLRLKNFN